ncbi:hypothetical protein RSAG8_02378, partial [Rhizoctonia solani AG-8 WAC10335]
MEGSNNLTYLLPTTRGGPPPIAGSPFPSDDMFALGYEIFILSGIGILMLFALPRFLRSQRKYEGWRLHQSKRLTNPTSDISVIHITRSKTELTDGEIGTKILSPKVHKVSFPELCRTESDDGSSELSRKGETLEKVHTNEFAERATNRPMLPQRQGVNAAYMDWVGAKMTKFIGGPVGMHLGPWLIVLVINIVANALVSLAPPFFVAPDRPAHIAIAQIPILFVLGTKNNILSYMLGKSYEKLNFVHRTVGRLLFVCATLHVIGQFIKYSTHGVLGQAMRVPWVQAGLAAWIGLILVTFASVGIVRIKFYDFFLNSHMIGIFVFMVTLHFHMPAVVMPYTLSGLAFYLIDLVFRACRMRIKPATISAIDDQMTLIAVHGIEDGWRAGQHVWVRILQGDRSWESHPFTIANAPASHTPDTGNSKGLPSRGLLLYARVAGNFTRALNFDARRSSGIQTNVIVDGPYGGLGAGTVDLADYRNVILVAGGGGASFTIAVLEDLVSRSLEQKACTTVVDFIWIVKDYDHLNWYMSTIKQIILAADSSAISLRRQMGSYLAADSSAISLRVCLYVTKLETAPNGKLDRPLPPLPSQSMLNPEDSSIMDVIFKRPDVPALVSEAISYAALAGQSSSGGGVAADSSAISLRVCLYVTKLETAPNGKLDRPLPPLPSQSMLNPEDSSIMDVIFKRPDVPALVSEAISYAALAGQSSSGGGGVMISACGPAPMIRDVQLAARKISIRDRRLAGGVSLHTEAFGF